VAPDSPRKCLSAILLKRREGIEAIRRFEISSLYMEMSELDLALTWAQRFASHTLDYFFATAFRPM